MLMKLTEVIVAFRLEVLALSVAIGVHYIVIYLVDKSEIGILLQLCCDVVYLQQTLPEPVSRVLELLIKPDYRSLPFIDCCVLHCKAE